MDYDEKIEKKLKIPLDETRQEIINFIRRKVKDAETGGVVLGLSGGLDSSTTAFLCAEALGEENVLALFMPEKEVTDSKNAEDVKKVAETLGIKLKTLNISSIAEKIEEKVNFKESAKIANANLRARTRMVILYYYSNSLNYLVAGGSNKSELRCGYFTKYGDGASDILPIGSLYKTQVRKIAREIGVPERIIKKPPSADLWKGQKDEKELGLPYEKIDRIYVGIDIGLKESEIAETLNIKESKVREFKAREKNSKHKLRRPPAPQL